MTGVIGGSIVAFGVITALALVDCPLAVVTGAAFGMLGLSLAWTRLWWVRERRRLRNPPGGALGGMSPWEDWEWAALDDAEALKQILGAIPVARREGKFL